MAHGSDVALTTHDTIWHDIANMDWLAMVEMSSCFELEAEEPTILTIYLINVSNPSRGLYIEY